MLLIRPHTVAIASCVYRTRFFCTLLNSQSVMPRVTLDRQPRVCFGIAPVTGHRRLSFRVTSQVNDSGSIDSPLMQSMEKKIKEHLNAESVTVKDAYGDGRHVSIDVVASAFEGESAVNRQRMVYKSIWEELQNTVHAVDQMTTRTPNEAASN